MKRTGKPDSLANETVPIEAEGEGTVLGANSDPETVDVGELDRN